MSSSTFRPTNSSLNLLFDQLVASFSTLKHKGTYIFTELLHHYNMQASPASEISYIIIQIQNWSNDKMKQIYWNLIQKKKQECTMAGWVCLKWQSDILTMFYKWRCRRRVGWWRRRRMGSVELLERKLNADDNIDLMAMTTFSPVGLRSSNGMRMCVRVCVDGMNLTYALHWLIHISVHSVLCQCYTQAHAHTHILKPSEDSEPTWLKVIPDFKPHLRQKLSFSLLLRNP